MENEEDEDNREDNHVENDAKTYKQRLIFWLLVIGEYLLPPVYLGIFIPVDNNKWLTSLRATMGLWYGNITNFYGSRWCHDNALNNSDLDTFSGSLWNIKFCKNDEPETDNSYTIIKPSNLFNYSLDLSYVIYFRCLKIFYV